MLNSSSRFIISLIVISLLSLKNGIIARSIIKPTILIYSIKSNNVKNDRVLKTLTSTIEKLLRKEQRFSLIERKIALPMISENIEELNNCDSNCFSEIGALVNANYLINGNLKKMVLDTIFLFQSGI